MKVIYLVLDGAAGDPALGPTAYMVAEKPGLDYLARMGVCGMAYPIRKGIAPESDAAVLSILGYDPDKYYTGRGPLEALGVEMALKEGWEVAFRGNFATVDPVSLEIVDRRAGRDLSDAEAKELALSLDGMELQGGEGYARVKQTVKYRLVVIVGHKSKRLSDAVGNTDPAYQRRGRVSVALKEYPRRIVECIPLEDTEEAKLTAMLVNEFTTKSIEILKNHPVNIERKRRGKLPANAVLLRDAGGRMPRLPPISSLYGLSFTALVEMPVEAGIARAAGMRVVKLPLPTGNPSSDYELRAKKTIEALEEADAVYVHLKGPDEPGHDGDLEAKKRAIENIDRFYLSRIMNLLESGEAGIIVTSDHATPWQLKAHSSAPVPVLVYAKGVKPDGVHAFNEVECKKGRLGIIEKGCEILGKALKVMGAGELGR